MKNKEKYAKEIAELACDGMDIAVDEATGTPVNCDNIRCPDCMFNGKICSTALKEWAESEYIEKPVISKKDRIFLDFLKDRWKYMARDNVECLKVFFEKPFKARDMWSYEGAIGAYNLSYGLNVDFPMVKWSDSEPWLIEDLKKLEVVEDYE